jgi:GrpB-like predicted nucleotidyltransferase (UPF0157 family)
MKDDLNNLTTEQLGQLFPIILSEYDPGWPVIYEAEKNNIINTIHPNNILSVEHIGSTAVPGLTAKPTIDILIQVRNSFNSELFKEDLKKIGYDFIPKPENPPPHMMFAKGYAKTGISGQTFHSHIRYKGDWDEIVFRDFLRSDPEISRQYAYLKLELARKFPNDREKYTESKSEFIRSIILVAREKRHKGSEK